jgi:hypothetical protein
MCSQLRLFFDEDTNLGISPDRYIKEIGGKAEFEARHQVKDTTLAAFEKANAPKTGLFLCTCFSYAGRGVLSKTTMRRSIPQTAGGTSNS